MGDMDNKTLVEKAVITTDALAAAGKLNPEQADKFLDYVIDETTLKDHARMVKFRAEQAYVDKINVGTRVAVPKAEAQDPGTRRGVATSRVVLQPVEIMVPIEISDNFMEENLEGDNVEDAIIKMFAKQLANDWEELNIGGDALGPSVIEDDILPGGDTAKHIKDAFLALYDGWLRLSDSGNIVDLDGANIGLKTFSEVLRALPTKFRRNKNDLRWFMSSDLWQIYAEALSSRATALGDAVAGGSMHKPFGIQPVEVPLLELQPKVVEHVNLPSTTAVQLRYKNISNVVVTPSTLANIPTTPFIDDTDYDVVASAGTIARDSGGAIGDNDLVKVTYSASPQLICTHKSNLIIAISRDVRIEKDRDIFKTVNQYAITAKVHCEFEEITAVAKGKNIGYSL